ncbi:tetratricopeptide repeat protein [Desertivirga arenae]|uniref:tetratricopeptide repeat protein n=1 Tax=Desertivirga arenae TaxID=2810309 RepID=UPI001A967CF9|nr:tetratricopeptide repeat protein [Pedobacter sp. SYSU D00823]
MRILRSFNIKTLFFSPSVMIILLVLNYFNASAQRTADDALALQYYQNAEYDRAAIIYEKLFTRSSNPALYYDQYLNSLIKIKRYDDAEKVVKKMVKEMPENPSFKIDLGRVLQEQGQQAKANEWYNNIIKDLPPNEHAIREISIAFYRATAYDYATKALLQGRKLLKDENIFSYDLISLYRYQKNKPMLIQEYLSLLSSPDIESNMANQAKNAFSAVLESSEDYDQLRIALLRKMQKEPQNVIYPDLLAWLFYQQKEYSLALKQLISLDKRQKEEGERVYEFAGNLIASKAYEPAVEALNYLVSKGKEQQYYIPAKIQLLNCKNQLLTSGKFTQDDLLQLEKDYKDLIEEFGKTHNTIFAIRQLANLQAFYLHKLVDAEKLLENALKMPALPPALVALVKLDLGDVYVLNNEPWEAALIYGQVEKEFPNEPNGQEAKFKGARLSYYQGEFNWAKAQLDVLKSSTSQLTANDALNLSLLIQENTATGADTNALKKFAYADLLAFKNDSQEALVVLDSIQKLYPGNSLEDDILMTKAKIFLKQQEVQEALKQLQLITVNHSFDLWADDAWFMMGDIYENQLQDKEKAKQCYQKIITDFPGSILASEARKRFRNLRGDAIG